MLTFEVTTLLGIIPVGLAIRLMLFADQKFRTEKGKFIRGVIWLTLLTLRQALLLRYFLYFADMEQALVPAVIPVVIADIVGIFALFARYMTRKKRELTPEQKVELMEL